MGNSWEIHGKSMGNPWNMLERFDIRSAALPASQQQTPPRGFAHHWPFVLALNDTMIVRHNIWHVQGKKCWVGWPRAFELRVDWVQHTFARLCSTDMSFSYLGWLKTFKNLCASCCCSVHVTCNSCNFPTQHMAQQDQQQVLHLAQKIRLALGTAFIKSAHFLMAFLGRKVRPLLRTPSNTIEARNQKLSEVLWQNFSGNAVFGEQQIATVVTAVAFCTIMIHNVEI